MTNITFAKLLTDLGDLLELSNANPFRIRAIRRASEIMENHPTEMATLSRKEWLAIPGIGKGVADMLEEFLKSGHISDLETLKKKFPQGVLDVMNLQGLGPKRAGTLFAQLKIDSLDKLAQAAKSGKLTQISGFGPKLQHSILENISFAREANTRVILRDALDVANQIIAYLKKSPHIKNLTLAGSARRWKETIGDLDFLCTSRKPEMAIQQFISFPDRKKTLAEGKTKASLVLNSGLQCDFRVVEPKSFGAALLYFTGSQQHNVRLRERAQKKGYSLNEYGLYKNSDKKKLKPIASESEEGIYKKLGLEWIAPELREDRGEITASLNKKLPRLITEKDILGDIHNHTHLSDGENSVEEMVQGAQDKGWKWYFCADHSPSLTVANGLDRARLKEKLKKLKKLNSQNKKMGIYSSSEVDILARGDMDYPDPVLAELDAVVASVHSRFKQTEQEMTDRICNAIKNPHVDILGHISGRLLNRRKGYEIHYDEILQTALQTQTAIEINGQPDRSELSDIHVKKAVEMGIPLILSTDAHSIQQLSHMTFAVHIARRGWVEKKDILNSKSEKEILQWLKK